MKSWDSDNSVGEKVSKMGNISELSQSGDQTFSVFWWMPVAPSG